MLQHAGIEAARTRLIPLPRADPKYDKLLDWWEDQYGARYGFVPVFLCYCNFFERILAECALDFYGAIPVLEAGRSHKIPFRTSYVGTKIAQDNFPCSSGTKKSFQASSYFWNKVSG